MDQVDWAGLHVEKAPQWIRGLASKDQSIRKASFYELRDCDLHERPDVACFVVPYVLRILEHQDINQETEILVEFLRALRQYAKGFIRRNLAVESATTIINDIENSKELYARLSAKPLARDAALDLISDIENG